MSAALFLVSTPIGNLEDITLRALRVLREVDVIAAEDTRHTAKLLSHFDIKTPTTSFYDQVEADKAPRLVSRMKAGERIALVSDAGTPGISDPGFRLVQATVAAGLRVEAVPGPSALLTALVASGLPTDTFAFVGFPPPKAQARDRWLAEQSDRVETFVFYEAPHRVRETLSAALSIWGDRQIVIGRELTKIHESLVRGPISSILASLGEPIGEFTVVVAGVGHAQLDNEPLPDPDGLLKAFYHLTETEELARRAAITRLARRYGIPSRELYALVEAARDRARS